MNQILQTENKKSSQVEIKKVVMFFAIAMIILGVVLIGQGSYAMITGTKEEEKPQVQNTVPEVNIGRTEENILIDITHTKPITSVTYYWNEEAEQSIETNNNLVVAEEITLPFGNNTLNLTVIDQDGNEFNYVKEYVLDGDGKPVIELLLTKENKIRIKVQDVKGLKYIRYTWNSGNYVTVQANVDNLKLIDELAEIPLGQNTLRVEAVNVDDMITTKELEVKGVRRPIVSLRQDGSSLIIRAEDEVAMKVVNFTLNGQKYQINFGEVKVIEHRIDLKQGENRIELSAENIEGGITEIKGKCIVE
ncbi:MAG: hypothetical protein J6A04_05270 [Clostridia bacterium]|nr:hypothetical protein [Clostridia bacterium]